MKQATVKSLGAAALGAAFAATTAGSASAAVTDTVQQTADDVVNTLPAGSAEVLDTGTAALSGNSTELPVLDTALSHTETSATGDVVGPAESLLGGLPVAPSEITGLPAEDMISGLHML
jgi:hypothetical protein